MPKIEWSTVKPTERGRYLARLCSDSIDCWTFDPAYPLMLRRPGTGRSIDSFDLFYGPLPEAPQDPIRE